MLCIGIAFILISILVSEKVNAIVLEIIATIGSFSVWEFANSCLVEKKRLRKEKIKLIRLKKADINFI